MTEQLSFEGLAPAPPTDRLFFAVFPDPETAGRIEALAHRLRGEHGLSGRPQARDRLHITLCHLGDYHGLNPEIVDKATAAADRLAAAPFAVRFDCAGSFVGRPDNRPFVLRDRSGAPAVTAFQRSLQEAMAASGLARFARPYTPHLTLLYDGALVAEHAIEPVGWTARELVLVHSRLRRTEHIFLKTWPLGAAG